MGKHSQAPFHSLGERVFSYPRIYEAKVKLLGAVNGVPPYILDPMVQDKEVLDLGCGSFQYYYHPDIATWRLGIDISPAAIQRADILYPNSYHVVDSLTDPLFLQDKSVDVTLLLFVFHHLQPEKWVSLLREAKRVTRQHIIVLDHTKNDSIPKALVQMAWWKTFDGGYLYPSEREWKEVLDPFRVEEYKRMGTLFNNVCYYRLGL